MGSIANAIVPNGHPNDVHRDGLTLLVGTFRSPEIYTLAFKPQTKDAAAASSSSLTVTHKSQAVGGHSWLALSPSKTHLYTTCWADPPTVASYRINHRHDDPHSPTTTAGPSPVTLTPLNTAPVASLSGYVVVTPSGKHLISAGGPTGEVFALHAADDGAIGPLVQTLRFRDAGRADDGRRDGVAHGAFGGLRWGAHSVDLSPDGRCVYVADIGHNCIWTYALDEEGGAKLPLRLAEKHISPRAHDGPRHAWPHPGGRVLYCVQEHSGIVDAFAVVGGGGTLLRHLHGLSVLPAGRRADDYWADEVRTSNVGGGRPRFLYASTRGLRPETKGYVAAFELDAEGMMVGDAAVAIYETRTSGGLANAIEPAPQGVSARVGTEEEFISLTDSEQGYVTILGFDGKRFREVAVTRLESESGEVVQAATAVWL